MAAALAPSLRAGCRPAVVLFRFRRVLARPVDVEAGEGGGLLRSAPVTAGRSAAGLWYGDGWGCRSLGAGRVGPSDATSIAVSPADAHRPVKKPLDFGGQLAAAGQPLVPMAAPADLSVPSGTVRRCWKDSTRLAGLISAMRTGVLTMFRSCCAGLGRAGTKPGPRSEICTERSAGDPWPSSRRASARSMPSPGSPRIGLLAPMPALLVLAL